MHKIIDWNGFEHPWITTWITWPSNCRLSRKISRSPRKKKIENWIPAHCVRLFLPLLLPRTRCKVGHKQYFSLLSSEEKEGGQIRSKQIWPMVGEGAASCILIGCQMQRRCNNNCTIPPVLASNIACTVVVAWLAEQQRLPSPCQLL